MRSPLLFLTAVAVLALAACSSGSTPTPTRMPSPAGPEPTPPGMTPGTPTQPAGGIEDPAALNGRTFIGTSAAPTAPGDVTRVRLTFQDGAISGSGGCNSMGGGYEVVDGVLTTGAMMTTEMACPEPAMSMDTWLGTLLSGAKLTLDGDTLTLARDGVTLTLVDQQAAQPDLSLAQRTRWTLDSIAQGGADGTTSSVPAGVTAGITFMGDQANVNFGCNSGGGEVAIRDATLTFGPMISTKMACGSPADDIERVMQATLTGEVAYAIEGDTLTITDANGTILTFKGTAI
jgi:heat shock protein HslJ